MRPKGTVLIAGIGLLLAPTAVLAHHGLEAQFDTKKTVTLTGAVKKMDWSNPHVRLYVEVVNQSDKAIWEVDMGSPNLQLMAGWKIDTYRRGDFVRVDAYPAKNGANVAYGRTVRLLRK
jgi:Family of unknown function (DUF6152)